MDPVNIIEGAVTDLPRDDVDTDQIIPARYMKRVERTGFGEFAFHEWRQKGLDLPPNPILVVGDNFGCGSSREHAPWALLDYGFRAIGACSRLDPQPKFLPPMTMVYGETNSSEPGGWKGTRPLGNPA